MITVISTCNKNWHCRIYGGQRRPHYWQPTYKSNIQSWNTTQQQLCNAAGNYKCKNLVRSIFFSWYSAGITGMEKKKRDGKQFKKWNAYLLVNVKLCPVIMWPPNTLRQPDQVFRKLKRPHIVVQNEVKLQTEFDGKQIEGEGETILFLLHPSLKCWQIVWKNWDVQKLRTILNMQNFYSTSQNPFKAVHIWQSKVRKRNNKEVIWARLPCQELSNSVWIISIRHNWQSEEEKQERSI
jgi:hypothetical protein